MSDAAIIAAAGVITTILVNYFQERRVNQKFEHQRKAAEDQEARQTRAAEALAKRTERVAAELKQETRIQAEAIGTELRRNTELTGMAYNAANNFELKLERLAKVFDSVHTDREVQKQLVELATNTNEIVHDHLQPDVAEIKETLARDDAG
jgi:triphosphoribosyl-dephospho-CoA synthetase